MYLSFSVLINKKILLLILYRLLYRLITVLLFFIESIESLVNLYFLKPHGVVDTVYPDEPMMIYSDTGHVPLHSVHLKKQFVEYEIETSLGKVLRCADNHMVFVDRTQSEMFVSDVKVGDLIITANGLEKVIRKKRHIIPKMMYDVTTADANHRYYADGILHHNSITTAIYIVWYILCNTEKNIVLLSQNEDKVTDLMEKIKTIICNMPFYMKPGIVVANVMSMEFDNGVKLSAKTTTENSAAGITGHLIYIDEFALISPNFLKSFFRTVFPALSSSNISQMIITSTPRGTNKFFDLYMAALNGENSFNPLRTDWYEVPMGEDKDGNIIYRNEKWKFEQIADLGSEEDFNQEYGNQFMAGSQLLFGSTESKRMKEDESEFVEYEFRVLDDADCVYRDFLKFHPLFDTNKLASGYFVLSVDLASGGGGDYSVVNILQLMPMSRYEMDMLKIYSEEKDFFKLVQVGLFRSNTTSVEEVAKTTYHILTDLMNNERVKVVLETNYDGKSYVKTISEIYGEDVNILDPDSLFVNFKIGPNSERYRLGLTLDAEKRNFGCKLVKEKVKNRQLVIVETRSVHEAISFYKNKKGKYIGQDNDDIMMTFCNVCHIFDTEDFAEMVDEMLDEASEKLLSVIAQKMTKQVANAQYKSDDEYSDLFD